MFETSIILICRIIILYFLGLLWLVLYVGRLLYQLSLTAAWPLALAHWLPFRQQPNSNMIIIISKTRCLSYFLANLDTKFRGKRPDCRKQPTKTDYDFLNGAEWPRLVIGTGHWCPLCVSTLCVSTGRSGLSSVFYYSPGLPTVFTSPW